MEDVCKMVLKFAQLLVDKAQALFDWTTLFALLVGGVGGFLIRVLTMKIEFKQRTIDNKIRVYDSIIIHWLKTRNFIYSQLPNNPYFKPLLDKMYGDSIVYIGEAFLVSEDNELTDAMDRFNERFYRGEDLAKLSHEELNRFMDEMKEQGKHLIKKMREDVKNSTRFEIKDFLHMVGGFRKKKVAKT